MAGCASASSGACRAPASLPTRRSGNRCPAHHPRLGFQESPSGPCPTPPCPGSASASRSTCRVDMVPPTEPGRMPRAPDRSPPPVFAPECPEWSPALAGTRPPKSPCAPDSIPNLLSEAVVPRPHPRPAAPPPSPPLHRMLAESTGVDPPTAEAAYHRCE